MRGARGGEDGTFPGGGVDRARGAGEKRRANLDHLIGLLDLGHAIGEKRGEGIGVAQGFKPDEVSIPFQLSGGMLDVLAVSGPVFEVGADQKVLFPHGHWLLWSIN